MNITVTRTVQEGLRVDTWVFHAHVVSNASQRGVVLKLSSFSINERPSRRHKMKKRVLWDSYINSASHRNAKPVVPGDVLNEAKAALINSIIVEA